MAHQGKKAHLTRRSRVLNIPGSHDGVGRVHSRTAGVSRNGTKHPCQRKARRGGGPYIDKIPTRYQQDSATPPTRLGARSVPKLDRPPAGGTASPAGRPPNPLLTLSTHRTHTVHTPSTHRPHTAAEPTLAWSLSGDHHNSERLTDNCCHAGGGTPDPCAQGGTCCVLREGADLNLLGLTGGVPAP